MESDLLETCQAADQTQLYKNNLHFCPGASKDNYGHRQQDQVQNSNDNSHNKDVSAVSDSVCLEEVVACYETLAHKILFVLIYIIQREKHLESTEDTMCQQNKRLSQDCPCKR